MLLLLRLYKDILFGRRGPEVVPVSSALFGLTLLANLLISQVSLFFSGSLAGQGQLLLLITLAMPLSIVWLVLASQRVGNRYLQTVTGWLGADSLLTAISIPFEVLWKNSAQGIDAAQVPPSAQLALLFLFAIMIWSVWLLGFVVSRALGRSIWVGVAVALLNATFVMSAVGLLMPSIFASAAQ